MTEVRAGLDSLLRKSRRLRTSLSVIGLVLLVGAGIVFMIPSKYLLEGFGEVRDRAASIFALIGFVLVAATVSSYSDGKAGAALELELAPIREERVRIQEGVDAVGEVDVFRRLDLNLNQIAEYYTINKSQARSSFRFGVFAVTAGMATLVVAIALFLSDKSGRLTPAAITGVSGVLVQFVGASALVLYNKSLALLNLFYERLADLQEIMLAVILCDQVADDARRDEIRIQLIRSLFRRQGGSGASANVAAVASAD